MKVIDLLNKIANDEEVPKKIRINGYIFEYQGDDYLYIDKNNDNHEYWLFSDGYTDKFQWLDSFLKTEIEIIEDNKIERIDINKMLQTKKWKRDKKTWETLNQVIDYLNSKGE